ncbi:sigma-70 family RNA polymerase sigma factor [Mycetocola tolaasinivorans]|uniref:Sigma-70 family RNA polymerase sigma factor n=1 Tax=Mycetocola tolaasinivorans TaxID=76635 RepID=A0A3L7A531_9MICO|nr:sigma-70 family RNA polymerase sigma factor [Mycetocola tolaasinivorans]RLP75204.1 sigma-70 family RNA polymerase sigma factor [Mycetocola tolaasinivorans]
MTRQRVEAFEHVFRVNYVLVRRYAERRVPNAALAEDIAAETFAAAWVRHQQGDSIELPWLYRVAANKISDHYRSAERRLAVEGTLERVLAERVEETDELDRIALSRSLLKLTEREREAVMLTYWEGLGAAEVAVALSCSVTSAWAILSRARKKLRTLLDEPPVATTENGGRT